MKNKTLTPPKIFLKFFRWYCHPELQDYIEGDLFELYERRLKESGKRKADLHFIIDVIQLFRPGIIRPTNTKKHFNQSAMIKNYFTIGWRTLLRNKSYSAINISGLALSLTCGILIFTLVRHHLSFDNFHQDSDHIYRVVTELHRDVVAYNNNVPSPLGSFIRNDHTFTEKVGRIFQQEEVLITTRQGTNVTKFEEADGIAFAEPELFEIFNFPLLKGDKATALKEPNTAILTTTTARKYFGDKDPIGETIWLGNSIPFTITGVLNDFPSNTDIRAAIVVSWSSLKSYEPWLADDQAGWGGIRGGMSCFLRLRPNVKTAEVEEAIAPYVKRFRPNSKNVHHYKLQPLSDVHFNAQYGGAMEKSKLWVLSIIGAFLLITACVNFINLATAQALKRSKEVGVRKVLGSFKLQLFWQFIFETAIITFVAVAFAAVLAYTICPSVNELFQTQLSINLLTDGELLGFILALGLLVTLLAGYYPALVLAGFKPVAALKGRLSQQNVGGFNTRKTLITSQFAISQVLIIGVIVIMSQMKFAKESDLGFDREAIVMIPMGSGTDMPAKNSTKIEISRIPGVEKVSMCFTAPASEDDWGNSIRFDDDPEEVNFRTSIKSADADYASLFKLEFVAGHNLTPSDSVREIVVNERLASKLNLKPEEILGKTIIANGGSIRGPVVGVIKDFHDKSFHEEITPVLITTYSQDYSNYAVKVNLRDAKAVLSTIEKLWLQQHPDQIFDYEFLDDSIASFYESEETMLNLIQIFSFIAIFIGCLGLYGLVSFMTAQKNKEVGIRKVLGGSVQHIVWIFGREFLRLIFYAFVIAAPAGWWLMTSWLQDFKFQVSMSPWTFVMAIGASLVIAAITVSFQVARTAMMNPVKSLSSE